MTNITFYKTNNSFVGFRVLGHSGYAEEGCDIVWAGISVLTINFINSVDSFTNDKFILNENPDKALIEFKFKSKSSEQSQLLFKSLALGLNDLYEENRDFYEQFYERLEEAKKLLSLGVWSRDSEVFLNEKLLIIFCKEFIKKLMNGLV